MKIRERTVLTLGFMLLLLGGCAGSAVAQSTYSTIVGTVTDPNSAVVSGAAVTVTNKGTSATRTATTDSAGNFTIPNLDAGDYQVLVESKGFRKVTFQAVNSTQRRKGAKTQRQTLRLCVLAPLR